jgi:LysM repeat protein
MSAHTKAIYASYWAARHAGLRGHVLELLEETELNALVIDIKGEDGLLYDTFTQPTVTGTVAETGLTSPEFRVDILPPPDEGELTLDLSWAETAATSAAYDQVNSLETLMAWLKERGYYTIARVAAFRDNRLIEQRPELAIRDSRTGEPWRDDRGIGWADPFRSEAWVYNAAIAAEAAGRGFDEIQYDFIRFPAGEDTEYAQYAQENTPENRQAALNGLLSLTGERLRQSGTKLAVDFFGNTCWVDHDTGIGQVIESVAPHIDVLCPMLYPSTFGSGLPGLPQYEKAIDFPYEVINLSTLRAVERLKKVNPDAVIRPWLQDFPDYQFDGRTYTPQEIQEQMRGAIEGGGEGWILFDPRVKYTREALQPAVPSPPIGDGATGFRVVSDPTPHLVDPDGHKFFVVGVNYEGYFDRAWRVWDDDTFDLALIEKDFEKARQVGFNVLRLFVQTSLERDIRAGVFDKLDQVLELAAHHGLNVLLTLNDDHSRNLADSGEIAAAIASRYRDDPTILGYDLENEPKLYNLLVAEYPEGYPAPVQSPALVEHYGERVSRDEVEKLRQERKVPSFLDDEMAYCYANALRIFLEFDTAVREWTGRTGQTLADYIRSPDSEHWSPYLEVMNGTIAAWIAAQRDPMRAAAPHALITVGWDWMHFAAMPANEVLDFHEFHVYGSFGLGALRAMLNTLESLQRHFPDIPTAVGEFGYSNATTSDPATSQPVPQTTTALYEGALLAYLRASGFAGGIKWMLNDVTGVHNPFEASLGVFTPGNQPKVVADVIRHYVDLWSLTEEPGEFSLREDPIADLGYRYSLPRASVTGGVGYQDSALDWQAEQDSHLYLAWAKNVTVEALTDGELSLNPPEFLLDGVNHAHILHRVDDEGHRVPMEVVRAGERVNWRVEAGQTYVITKGAKEPEEPPAGEIPEPGPGEHVVILPDLEAHLEAARAYLTRFWPDVTFRPDEAVGRWPYVTIVGNTTGITAEQEAALREAGAWVERISGDTPVEIQGVLDQLAAEGRRFLVPMSEEPSEPPAPPPPPQPSTYVVQPGDTLWLISVKVYGTGTLWEVIFEANRDILDDPSRLRPGQVLKIPPKPVGA